jgi:hypothetical protein
MHDRRADGEPAGMQGPRSIREPCRESIPVLDVDVLDVELNAPVPVATTQLDERRDGTRPGSCIREQTTQRRLIEALVHHERHELDAARLRQLDHAPVE